VSILDRFKSSLLSIVLIIGVLFLLLCSHTTDLWAYEQCTYYYEALLDTDDNVSTGGDVGVVQSGGADIIHGVDYRVVVNLDLCSGPDELGPIVVWRWNGSAFVQQATYNQYYPIGFENGDVTTEPDHADVIEFRALKSDIGNPQGPMKIVYHASRTGNPANDYTAAFFYPERTATAVPSFSHWGIILFGVLLAISAIWIAKKRNSATIRVLCSLLLVLSIAGVVSANLLCLDKICLDGLIEDWNEISATPSVTDPIGDSSIGDEGEDIFKGFITSDDTNFYFRVDIVGGGIG
jgi:hypothetical protein